MRDINGDGVKDALVACSNAAGQDLSVLRGSGNGSFVPPVNFAVGMATSGVALGDYNGDGRTDVALSARAAGQVHVLTNNSPSVNVSFATPYGSYGVGQEPVALLGYDLTGDGRAELITANRGTNQIGVLVGAGNGTFQLPPRTASVGSGPIALAAGLLNADQRPDLVVANFDSGTVSVLSGQGDGTFALIETLPTAEKPIAIAIADMDRDGKPDLVVANSGVNGISVYLGLGDGRFDPPQQFRVGLQPWALAVTDLDHDGAPDVATANLAGGDVSILYNRTGL